MEEKENRDSPFFEGEDEIANFAGAFGIHPGGGLIEHDQAWFLDQCLREPDSLQHSFGVTTEATIARPFQPNEREKLACPRCQLASVQTGKFPVKAQRFFASEIFVEIGIFRKKSDCFATSDFPAVAPKDSGLARGWRDQAEDDFSGLCSCLIR